MFNGKNLSLFFIAILFLLVGLALPTWQPAEPVFALTATPSQTAVSPPQHGPRLSVALDCTVTDAWQVTLRGEGWAHYEPIALFANGRLRGTYDVGHETDFQQVWTLGENLERPLTIVASTGFRTQIVTLQPCAGTDTAFLPFVAEAFESANGLDLPDIILSPDCAEGPTADLLVTGVNWDANEDVALFWNGRLQAQVSAPHPVQFHQTWQVPAEPFQNPLIAVSPSSGIWRIFSSPCSDPPIPTVTPFGGGPTATPCGDNCPPPITPTSFPTEPPCTVNCPGTLTPTPCTPGNCYPTATPYITFTPTPCPAGGCVPTVTPYITLTATPCPDEGCVPTVTPQP
ncbi:MAG: hypothetical protein AAF614_10820 [Chloroflexota bacterium]